MTIEEKIDQGILRREVVEKILKKYQDQLKAHEATYEKLTGFTRDSYINNNNIMGLNLDIKAGLKIMAVFKELEEKAV